MEAGRNGTRGEEREECDKEGSKSNGYLSRASYDHGESISTLRAEVKGRHGLMPVGHHLDPFRDHAAQPGSTAIRKTYPYCAAPRIALNHGPSEMELDRVARTLRNMIIGGHPLSIFRGCSEG